MNYNGFMQQLPEKRFTELLSRIDMVSRIEHYLFRIFTVVVALIGVLTLLQAELKRLGDLWSHFTLGDFGLPFAISAAAAFLLLVFTLVLRREPSKVTQLRQTLLSAYLDRLPESIKGRDVADKA
jgi:hypothetical protein